MQRGIGVDDAHERHIVEIQTLRDHLRAQQHRARCLHKALKQLLVRAFRFRGVGIHANHGNIGKLFPETHDKRLKLRLNALCTRAKFLQIRASALGTHCRRRLTVPAMMANAASALFVIRQRC